MGAGIIICNNRGGVIATQFIKIIGKFNPVRAGLVFVSEKNICIKSIENDSINAVAMVNSPGGLSSNDLIASGIRSLLRLGGCGTCNFIPRSGNKVAYALT